MDKTQMVNIKTLKNGVRLVTEQIPTVRSASIGVWIANGSRYETGAGESGASHFIEHMLFKGTDTLSAARLADEMDLLGGEINAFTTKECTCFYGRVLDARLARAAELLADMLLHSAFDPGAFELERGVINEEISMYEDAPDDLALEKLSQAVYGGTCLGRPILGTRESLREMTAASLKGYMGRKYVGGGAIVSVAGNFSERDIARIEELFSALPPGGAAEYAPAAYKTALSTTEKQTEQSHIALAFPGIRTTDPRRFAFHLFNNLFGGSMSSRLFQRIREQLGLCYSIYSFVSSSFDTGLLGIYVGTGRETEQKAMEALGGEIRRVLDEGVSQSELERSCEQVKSGMLMALESTSSRMSHMGKGLLYHGAVKSVEEIAESYDRVTVDMVNEAARASLSTEGASVSVVTTGRGAEKYREWLVG